MPRNWMGNHYYQKPLYEKQVDSTVINVQNSITSTGGTALEVLEKSPGVIVNRQNSSISMSGKSGVLVMINGKINRLPVDAVVQMLDGMSAANIEKIELITTPPAKYDAEGDLFAGPPFGPLPSLERKQSRPDH